MPSSGISQFLLSPAELSYIHSSLARQPPIRPDLRSQIEYRPLIAETDILPAANGSARICFSDGAEAIAGVKVEIEKTQQSTNHHRAKDTDETEERVSSDSWLEISVEIPGFRDDDSLPVFLGALLTEALVASGSLRERLYINPRWHWKLYIDVLSLSPPQSYPLPLLSFTTHLALLNTALPRIVSEPSDDPLFDDDWAAAVPIYPRDEMGSRESGAPLTLLVMTVGSNIIFDPSKEELAAAETLLAISFTTAPQASKQRLKLLAVRSIDPPSRHTTLSVPSHLGQSVLQDGGPNLLGVGTPLSGPERIAKEYSAPWIVPRGGLNRALLNRVLQMALGPGGVGEEILEGLAKVTT